MPVLLTDACMQLVPEGREVAMEQKLEERATGKKEARWKESPHH